MCFWYLFLVYVLAVARKHKFIRQSHQVFQSEFQSELFKNSATTNKIISICLISRQDIVNILKELQSEKADRSGILQRILIKTPDGFTYWLRFKLKTKRDRLSMLQLWTHIPTYYLKVSTTYQLFQTVNQSSAVRHDFNLRYRLFSSFKVRKIK